MSDVEEDDVVDNDEYEEESDESEEDGEEDDKDVDKDAEKDVEKDADKEDEIEDLDEKEIERKIAPEFKGVVFEVKVIDRKTSNFLTDSEFARVKSIRANQIERHGQIAFAGKEKDNIGAIVLAEIIEKKCPLSIKRIVDSRITDGAKYIYVEIWQVNEMSLKSSQLSMSGVI